MIIGFLTCRLKATFIECYSKNKQLHFKRREYLVIQNEAINQEKYQRPTSCKNALYINVNHLFIKLFYSQYQKITRIKKSII